MKNFSYLATIAATALAIALPVTAGAQGIFQQRSEPSVNPDRTLEPNPNPTAPAATPNGYTTNFSTTTTTVSPGTYPRNHSFGKFSNYGSFSRYKRSNRNGSNTFYQNRQQRQMRLNPNPLYPGFSSPDPTTSVYGNYGRSKPMYPGFSRPDATSVYGNYGRSRPTNSCSTAVIGSPIPSAVPLDRSGRPCN